jgi:hypothetical protein
MESRNRLFALCFSLTSFVAVAAHADAPSVWPSDSVDAVESRPVNRRALRRDLARRRALMIRRLAAYSRAGVFPDNHVQPGMLNVFIDDEGHICAAANLIARDGHRDLVEQQARENNFIRLADVHSGAIHDWMLRSGLTQEEIALIQEPYMYIPGDEPVIEQRIDEEEEKRRLQAHFTSVLRELRRDTRRSLDIAVDRLIASPAAS